MSEAAAAFFANKKRKKKAFKFNANLIDVSAVTQTTHVDAPALSKDIEAPAQQGLSTSAPAQTAVSTSNVVTDNEQESPYMDATGPREDEGWDEAVAFSRSKTVAASSAPEVLDMKSLAQTKGSDNISEKLRVEETKAQLAAAREGMEREAARANAEKERKEQEAKEKEAAKAANSGGGIWVSARMRAAAQTALPKIRMGAGPGQQLDTSNEELFPDLASADKILEEKEKASSAKGPKKTPVGGGASWATKTNTKTKTPAKPPLKRPVDLKEEEKKAPVESPKVEDEPVPSPDLEVAAPEPESEVAPAAPALPAIPVKPKKPAAGTGKKKKKDLSSFKPGDTK